MGESRVSKYKMQSCSYIYFWNCAKGLLNKLHSVIDIINEFHPAVLFIAEAEISRDFDLSMFNIAGYRIELSNTISLHGKSRLIAFVNNSYPIKRIPNLEAQGNEFIVLKIRKLIVTGVYFPFKTYQGETLQSNFVRSLENLKHISSTITNDSTLFVGDFNVDLNQESPKLDLLRNWTDAHGLDQLILQDTRSRLVRIDDSNIRFESSRIDHLYTSDMYNHSSTLIDSPLSDHCMILVGIKNITPLQLKRVKTVIVDWRKYDPEKMALSVSHFLRTANLDDLRLHDSITNSIIEAMNAHCPKRIAISRNDSFIISAKIAALTKKRDRLIKKIKKLKNENLPFLDLALKARSMSRHLRKVIAKEKARIVRVKIDGCSPRSFWRTIEQLLGRTKDTVYPIKNSHGDQYPDNELAELFSSFFQKKVSDLSNPLDIADVPPVTCNGVPNFFTEQDTLRAIEAMKPKRSSGPDEITMSIIKDCKQVLSPHLTSLFNRVLCTGMIPLSWKKAIVRPILKKGDPSDINNYRPISNLSSISKVFEKVILQRLDSLFPDLDGLNQHGFRKCHNTTTAALEIQHALSSSADNKFETGIYSIDLSAAFDLINPRTFYDVCTNLALDPWIMRILVNFICNRSAYVTIGQSNSLPFKLQLGCAQGSTLGPKIFNLYVSQLIRLEQSEGARVVSYADDSYVILSSDTRCTLLKKFSSVI